MRVLAAEPHTILEMPAVATPTQPKVTQPTVHRLRHRAQAGESPQFENSGFLKVELPATSEDLEPGMFVKVQYPTKRYLGAIAVCGPGYVIVELDLSTEYAAG